MRRLIALATGLLLLVNGIRADDAIPAETVVSVKRATAYIRAEGTNWNGTGSGFVISVNKDTVLLATNYHVISSPSAEKRQRPAEFTTSTKQVTVTAVFNGGTKNEVESRAEVIACDPDNDLAILRVTGLKAPPAAIDFASAPAPVETMTVYTFGYPFGQSLATGKGAPAITVGKASVSSLRLDDAGELSRVQIDGSLNPGNSGGPMVDTKGRLVGVAVSRVRDGQGIGFAVPAAELGRLMKGRMGGVHLTARKGDDNKLVVKAEVGLIDPLAALKGATLHYVVVAPKGALPKPGEPVSKHPGAKSAVLKFDGGVATAELTLGATDGEIVVQAVPDGVPTGAGRVRTFPLTVPKGAKAVVLGEPGVPGGAGAGETAAPRGWKEYTPPNKTFKVWFPDNVKVEEEQKATPIQIDDPAPAAPFPAMPQFPAMPPIPAPPPLPGFPPPRFPALPPPPRFPALPQPPRLPNLFNRVYINVSSAVCAVPDGPSYVVEQVIITPPRGPVNADEIHRLLRQVAMGKGDAKVTRETDVQMGPFKGKEYLIERERGAVRARSFVIGSSFYLLRSIGSLDEVQSADSTRFLESCRLEKPAPPPPAVPGATVAGGTPHDTTFNDPVPAKGALVGVEFGLGKIGENRTVTAARAVFQVGGTESYGPWHGPEPAPADKSRVVAKTGYVLTGLSVRATAFWVQGVTATFTKQTEGKLDPKDSYESDPIGSKDGPDSVAVGGKAEAPIGFVGKTGARGLSGLGLAFKAVGAPPPARATTRGPRTHGGAHDSEHREVAPAGGYLIGLEVGMSKWFNNDVVGSVRAVYRTGDKETLGEQFGTLAGPAVKVVAKPGYAVGALALKARGGLDSIVITFMKVVDGKLDPKDSYESERLGGPGGPGGREPVRVGGDGTLVVGLLARANHKDVTGLGLIYPDTNKPGLDAPWPRGLPTQIQGGGGDPEFREVGPEGSVLVGLEVGVGRFFDNPVIKCVRPVFRGGDKETTGEWHGPTDQTVVKEFVKVVAKPGYAVGVLTVRTGLGADGLSITFMKVVDGKLDPKDSYESEWVGGKGGGEGKVGDGTLAIGLIGKARADTVSGFGLLHPIAPKK
ncbi:Serine protease Do-like HtrA [Gemmata obscuriglobus]|uniref:Serine protease n=1 Tax=Gemmata obscuriglobus TaxID=114 RepID=A0A2Z3GSE6_9BACT|nr:serine protease [Gemmata obscuriglobus]AWM36268.1 serine protease [Gemmata obscuriglobus]QEG31127.1 Serine protease Do-like HtrA [Gemmata obscuriglobus]VTS10464.1 serine protease : Trypsin-like serine protease with C-terminal PDZ domain OS=Singulisphaera acidiphila (strain ATCC BAA-1392 / DSM 18658 / VKM B-2454 / MOB10) GN=Sinac_0451 PE=4 SV=1: Trypsin_2 [Gemmata obscuriglobus UQM 2246]